MKITIRDLQHYHACAFHMHLFAQVWPRASRTGVTVNRANLRKAFEARLEVYWLVKLFPKTVQNWFWAKYIRLPFWKRGQAISLLVEGARRSDAWHKAHPTKK